MASGLAAKRPFKVRGIRVQAPLCVLTGQGESRSWCPSLQSSPSSLSCEVVSSVALCCWNQKAEGLVFHPGVKGEKVALQDRTALWRWTPLATAGRRCQPLSPAQWPLSYLLLLISVTFTPEINPHLIYGLLPFAPVVGRWLGHQSAAPLTTLGKSWCLVFTSRFWIQPTL